VSDPVAGRVPVVPLALDEAPSVGVVAELDVDVVVVDVAVVPDEAVVPEEAVDVPDDDDVVPEELVPLPPLPPADGGFSV
jgi:hypothetical protein